MNLSNKKTQKVMTTLNSKSKRWIAKVRWHYRSLVRSKQKQKVDDNYILGVQFSISSQGTPKKARATQSHKTLQQPLKRRQEKTNSNANAKNATNLDPTTKIFTHTQNQPVTFGIFRNDGER